MEINTLEGIDTRDILIVFNQSFSDYFIPFQLTEEQLESKMVADKVHLNVSVGVFENGHLIAFILHGLDEINGKKIAYNGGTGVIPEKRGMGLSKQMYRFILPLLKEKGISTLFLEVITENAQALKVYKNSGYKIERKLYCYQGEVCIPKINNTIEISELHAYDWKLMQSFWDITPTWQNSNNVVDELQNTTTSLGAYIKNQLVGYVIYSPKNKRLRQIAVSKNFRQQKIASTLLHKLVEEHGDVFSLINVDNNSKPIHAFLQKIGFVKNLEQLEMKLQLDNNESQPPI